MTRGRSAGRVRPRGERGATLIEAALMAPVFFGLLFSVFEFGLVFRQYLTVSSADRNATRAASAAGNVGDADFLILKEVKRSTVALTSNELESIVVFKASSPDASLEDDAALQPCLTASVAGVCNRYARSDLDRPMTDFGGCASAAVGPDRFWCPTTRVVAASGPPDYVGVYISSRYDSATGIFGKNYHFSEQTIYRLEPQVR